MVYVVMVEHILVGVYRNKIRAQNLVDEWSKKDGCKYSIFEQEIDEGDV